MSEDFGAAIVDATVEAPITTSDSAVETPSTETTTNNDVDLAVIDSSTEESTEGKETELKNADGSEKTDEQKEDFRAKAAGKEPLPNEVRVALKALREMDPKNANIVRQLHGAYERYTAIKDALGNEGPNGLKSFLSEVGAKNLPEARAALAKQTEAFDSVRATDELLYTADPVLSQNVYDDMKAQGKEDQYPKVIANFLDHLKDTDEAGFYETTKPHVVSGLAEAGLPAAINSIYSALAAGDTEKAKATLKSVAAWYTGLRDEVSEKGKIDKALSEREAKLVEKENASQKADRTKQESGVAEECEHSSNIELGKFLGSFLRLPFFKEFSRESKIDIGNGIKERLYAALKADKGYQASMDSLWKGKTIDKSKMVSVHENWLRQNGDALVRNLIQTRYPSYARGGSAAGKAAAQVAAKGAASKAAASSVATGKAIYVAAKPTNLIREAVKIGGRQYTTNDLDLMVVTGKGFVRANDGKSVRLVTWRKA
jgi:hypothetical protein